MPSLTIGWEYLTGYAVATDPSSRDRAEWPPHPGRAFMALAAAYFETGEDAAEGDALRWLETLGDPAMQLPPSEAVFERSNVTVYVPVNDRAGPAVGKLQSAPSIARSKQPRTFPRVWVGHEPCYMVWPISEGAEQYREALGRLCRKVTRIGHSSSLVRMWVADKDEHPCEPNGETWVAGNRLADVQVRKISDGTLAMLAERFNKSARERHIELTELIESLASKKKAAKGKGLKERKAAIDSEIALLRDQAKQINPRQPLRPSLGLWSGYWREERVPTGEHLHTCFDTDLLVLTNIDGPSLPIVSTLAVTRALRGAVMSHTSKQPPPTWVSGHAPNGQPLQSDDDGHLACIPLPFVGREHADGHLLGIALAFPRSVERRERGRALGKLLLDETTGRPRRVKLTLGRLGTWTVLKRDWNETRSTLRPESWTAFPDGAASWASVTPVALDKFPKSDRRRDRLSWTHEVTEIIVAACARIGLPEPVAVDVDTTSWHRGSPRAVGKRRPLRGYVGMPKDADAAIGDGFPPFPCKGANASRPQIHVWLRFAEPVVGPILLGAGRYQGYGLCRPWKGISR